MARSCCKGLDLLHGKGLVHRDVRGANVLHTEDGGAAICDLDTVGPCDRIIHPELAGDAPTIWMRNNVLSAERSYGKESDMCMLGVMLQNLPGARSWSKAYRNFCKALMQKKLSASAAVHHDFFKKT